MDMERERGITIQSAAVTSFYRNHRLNLIDTPGHVDFTVEVERSLRVLDGVITLLDGSAGVQAQTLTVWKQAVKNQMPTIFFVNKMDKPNANFNMSIDSVENKLQLPGKFGNIWLRWLLEIFSCSYCYSNFEWHKGRRFLEFDRWQLLDVEAARFKMDWCRGILLILKFWLIKQWFLVGNGNGWTPKWFAIGWTTRNVFEDCRIWW